MAETSTKKSFDEALSDLELLAEVHSKLPSGEAELGKFVNREIESTLKAIHGSLVSNHLLDYLQRVTAVRTKMDEHSAKHDTKGMNALIANLLSNLKIESEKAVKNEVLSTVEKSQTAATKKRVSSAIETSESEAAKKQVIPIQRPISVGPPPLNGLLIQDSRS